MVSNLPGLRRSGINVLFIWVERLFGIIVTIVVTPIITRHFGLELVGVWLLVSQYFQHLTLLELGLNSGLTRYLARYRTIGDVKTASQYLSASVLSLIVIGGVIILVAPSLAYGFKFVFRLPSEVSEQVYWLVLMASITVGLSLPLRSGIGLLSSVHQFDRVAKWESLALAVRLALVLVCFQWFEPNLLLLGLITFVPSLFVTLMLFLRGRRAHPDLIIRRNLVSLQVLLQMLSLSGATIVITASAVLIRQSSPMLVGYQLGAELVAVLAFPILIVSAVMPLVGVANRLIGPIASQLAANNDKNALYHVTTTVGKYTISIGLLACLFFYYFGHLLFALWLGGSIVDVDVLHKMADNLVIIFIGFALAIPGFIMREVLMSVGNHWDAAKAEVFGSILGMVIGFGLMTGMNLGVVGMAIGVAIAFIIRGAGFLMMLGAKYLSVGYLPLSFECIGKPLAAVMLIFSVTEILTNQLPVPTISWLSAALSFLIAGFVWCLWVWFDILDPKHKSQINKMLSTLVLRYLL